MRDDFDEESDLIERLFDEAFKGVPFEKFKLFCEKFADIMLDDLKKHPERYLTHTDLERACSPMLPKIAKLPGFKKILEELKTTKQNKEAAV